MDKAEASVVRLTPEQELEAARSRAALMAARESRLRDIRYNQFLTLKREFDGLTPDEIMRLEQRQEVLRMADKAAVESGHRFNLGFGPAIRSAIARIKDVKRRLGWAVAKRFAIALGVGQLLILGGHFTATNYGPDGAVKWRQDLIVNGVTTVGLNHVLDVVFHADTQVTTWYIGLVNATPTFAAADTMGSHAGWTEATGYSQSFRVAWTEGAASSGSTTNAATCDFSMTGSATIAGMFLTSIATKAGTTGTLFATASFSGGNQAVGNGDTLKVTYTINATAS